MYDRCTGGFYRPRDMDYFHSIARRWRPLVAVLAAVLAAGVLSARLTPASADTTAKAPAALASSGAPQPFTHPGILVSRARLDFVKGRVAAGAQPWTSALTRVKSSRFARTTYTPAPVAVIDCKADDAGCTAEHDDAIAAYTQALLWYLTGQRAYAQTSIRIMNAWSQTMTGSNGNQAHLNHAWSGEVFPRAAEIIRYTFTPQSGETAFNVAAFSRMLTDVIGPQIVANTIFTNNSAGNWDLSMIDAQMGIAVFTDNHTLFDEAVRRWRARVPSYIYLTTDGPRPTAPPGGVYDDPAKLKCRWLANATITTTCAVPPNFTYLNGQTEETCRDISHTILGLEAMTNAAETAGIQKVDLYGEQRTRIVAGYEFNARWDAATVDYSAETVPAGLCRGTDLTLGGTGYTLGWEIAYNHYAAGAGVAMPYTRVMLGHLRPTLAALHMDYETLTHGSA
jgi:hypothetical protein